MTNRRRINCLLGLTGVAAATSSILAGCAAVAGGTRPPLAVTDEDGGRFVSYDAFPSRHVTSRKVVVWLPPGYDQSATRHAVLYMHDGQNLFDPATSMAGQPWAVDKCLAGLMRVGKIRRTMVVAIASTPDRRREYTPAEPMNALPPAISGLATDENATILSEEYLRFLVTELKPFIDANFRTLVRRDDTFIVGSSRGGLISLYALARYPEVFGAAGCLSIHWTITTRYEVLFPPGDARVSALAEAYLAWLAVHLPSAGSHRLYFDHGTLNLDSLYAPFQQQADVLLAKKGYRQGVDWMTKVFPGADHNEQSWRERLHIPLQFLLAP